jgi:hypothetical protein
MQNMTGSSQSQIVIHDPGNGFPTGSMWGGEGILQLGGLVTASEKTLITTAQQGILNYGLNGYIFYSGTNYTQDLYGYIIYNHLNDYGFRKISYVGGVRTLPGGSSTITCTTPARLSYQVSGSDVILRVYGQDGTLAGSWTDTNPGANWLAANRIGIWNGGNGYVGNVFGNVQHNGAIA